MKNIYTFKSFRRLSFLFSFLFISFLPAKVTAQTANSEATLNAAIAAAGATPTTITITGNFDISGRINLISRNITLISDAGGPFTIYRQLSFNNSDMFFVENNASLTIIDLILDGQQVSNVQGSIIYSRGNLTIADNACLQNHNTAWEGGAIVSNGTFVMTGGIIRNNTAPNYGGGVWINNAAATFIMQGGTITNNTSGHNGGGVCNYNSTSVLIDGGKIFNNTADYLGGGIYNKAGNFTIKSGAIYSNYAEFGAGIYNDTEVTSCTINGGAIYQNEASRFGGGIFNEAGIFIMQSGEIYQNTADHGAGIYNERTSGTFAVGGGNIYGNMAREYGGGIFNNTQDFTFTGTGKIYNNQAMRGGGIYNENHAGSVWMLGGEISGNTATERGGGVFNNALLFTLSGGRIFNNSSERGGGVFNETDANFTMTAGEIFNNTASQWGGGVSAAGILTMTGGVIYGNSAPHGGGIFARNTVSITDGIIRNNTATLEGGGIYMHDLNQLTGTNVTFSNNIAEEAYWLQNVSDTVIYNPGIPITAGDLKALTAIPQVGYASLSASPAASTPFIYPYNNYDVNFVGVETPIVCPDTVSDDEGNKYVVVKLAGLCWTSNLKATKYAASMGGADIPFAKPYNNSIENAHIFGSLYTWNSAVGNLTGSILVQGICPDGWHIPSQAEWNLLNQFPAEDLKSFDYWIIPGGTNATKFDARPAGKYNGTADKFVDLYGATAYWSCNEVAGQTAIASVLSYYCNDIQNEITLKMDGLSVRCVMD